MLNFSSQVEVKSEKFPGVWFVVRRLSKLQRDKLTLEALEDQVRIAELWDRLRDKIDDPNAKGEALRIDAEIGAITSAKLKPLYLRAGLVKLYNVNYDGKDATVDLLIEYGPDELVDEIWLAINAHAKLTVEQQGNSPSATPSSEAATVAENSSTATPASA